LPQLQSGKATVDVLGGRDRKAPESPVEATGYAGKTWAVPRFTDAGMF
jgi:hypothetical protein